MAVLFFHVTLFTTVQMNGNIGVATAEASLPPRQDNRPSMFVVPFQRGGDYVQSIAVAKVQQYVQTLLSMNSTIQIVKKAVKPEPVDERSKERVVTKPLEQHPDLEKADKALWKGKEAMQKSKWSLAVRKFQGAIKLYTKRMALLEDMDKLVDAQLFLALTRFAQGYADDGTEALARVLVMRPDLIVDRRWQSPDFGTTLTRLKAGLTRVPTGTIRVTCPSKACMIYVDGRLKGTGTADIDALPRGHHWVRVVADGYKPWAMKVMTPGKGDMRIVAAKNTRLSRKKYKKKRQITQKKLAQVSPGMLESAVHDGDFGSSFLKQARTFTLQSGADYILMGLVNRVGNDYVVAAFMYSADKNRVAEVTKTTFALDTSDVQTKLLEFENRVTIAVAAFPMDKIRGKPQIYAKWSPPAPPAPKVVVAPPAPRPVVQPVVKAPVRPAPVARPAPVVARRVAPAPVVVAKKTRKKTRLERQRERRARKAKRIAPVRIIAPEPTTAQPVAPTRIVVAPKQVAPTPILVSPRPAPAVQPVKYQPRVAKKKKKKKKRAKKRRAKNKKRARRARLPQPIHVVSAPPRAPAPVLITPKVLTPQPTQLPPPVYAPRPVQQRQPVPQPHPQVVLAPQPDPVYAPRPVAQPAPSPRPVAQQPQYQQPQPQYQQPQPQPYQQQPQYGRQPQYQPQYQQPQPYQQPQYRQPQVAQQPQYQQPRVAQQPQQYAQPPQQAYAGSYGQPMVRPTRPFTVLARAPGAAPGMQPQPNTFVPMGDEGPAWYEQWWVWTLLGLVTAGGITAGVILGLPAEIGPPTGFSAGIRLE